MKKFVFAVGLMVLFALPAAAQGKKVGENVTYKKTTVYSFEAVTLILCDGTTPSGDDVGARRPVKQPRLIKVREEFKDKVMQSVGDL